MNRRGLITKWSIAMLAPLAILCLLAACDQQPDSSGTQGNATKSAENEPFATKAEPDSPENLDPDPAEHDPADRINITELWLRLKQEERKALEARGQGLEWWTSRYAESYYGHAKRTMHTAVLATKPFAERPPMVKEGSTLDWQLLLANERPSRWWMGGRLHRFDMDGDGRPEFTYQDTNADETMGAGKLHWYGFGGGSGELPGLAGLEAYELLDYNSDGQPEFRVLDWKQMERSGNSGDFIYNLRDMDGAQVEDAPPQIADGNYCMADLDGDGERELVCWDDRGADSKLYLYEDGAVVREMGVIGITSFAFSARLDDSGGEGIVMRASEEPHGVSLLRMVDGFLLFEAIPCIEGLDSPACAVDVDGDGIDELLCEKVLARVGREPLRLDTPEGWDDWLIQPLRTPELRIASFGGQRMVLGRPQRVGILERDALVGWDSTGKVVFDTRFGVDIDDFELDADGRRVAVLTAQELLLGVEGE
ncbi:MAG: hypothetical protein H7A35_00145 [Planctomycetales bacterium]|nr:hypothetical protein [bacterium]UNM08473.1 MAG: hypothetical protein H7A35_00145 [Planctomycetales bacterium]